MAATPMQLALQLSRVSLRNAGPSTGLLRSWTASSSSASSSRIPARLYSNTPALAAAPLSSMRIGTLKPAQPVKTRKRVGRGHSSGRGKTATRGHKGQKARSGNGKPTPGYEGGQTPLMRRYPKRGFTNIFAKAYAPVNVGRIQKWIDDGRLDASKPISAHELYASRCIHDYHDGVKVLGDGAHQLRDPIQLVVSRASSQAIAAVEAAGGTIVCKYYTRTSLEALVKPDKYYGRLLPRDPDPIAKKELVYYTSAAKRGYLSTRQPTPRQATPSQ